MKKIAFLEWMSFGNDFVINALKHFGYEVKTIKYDVDNEDIYHSEVLYSVLVDAVNRDNPEFVFSFNFYPIASTACNDIGVPYVSWTYDSPYVHLYSKEIYNSTNRTFVFDKSDSDFLKSKGVDHIYYLPVGSGADWYDRIHPSSRDRQKYNCDIAFIGHTYATDTYHLYDNFVKLSAYEAGYIDGIISSHRYLYGINALEELLDDDVVNMLLRVFPYEKTERNLRDVRWVLAQYLIGRKVTALERKGLLEALASRFDVKLYTSETENLPSEVMPMGWIDYYNDAPLAIKCAKINLNNTLKSIKTGIPLRVMDILGCGGFMMTNWQDDLMEYFEPGKDFVIYSSEEDAVDLATYYLQHDQERERIAYHGYETAWKTCSWERQVEKIVTIVK